MQRLRLLKTSYAKELARQSKSAKWEHIFLDSYSTVFKGVKIIKRKISKNYWHFTLNNDITVCQVKIYQNEVNP
jgi:hypothetical protein